MTQISSNLQIKCAHCSSFLILVEKKTIKIENDRSPITTSIYKCSNPDCQSDIDKRTKVRIKLQKDQEKAKKDRIKLKAKVKN